MSFTDSEKLVKKLLFPVLPRKILPNGSMLQQRRQLQKGTNFIMILLILTRTETPFNPIDGPIDGHRNFSRWASMDHRWPSMGFELSPSAWGQLWSIFGLNISNFNLLSFPFEPEQAFSSLKITYIGALSLNCLKKLKNLAKLQLFA